MWRPLCGLKADFSCKHPLKSENQSIVFNPLPDDKF